MNRKILLLNKSGLNEPFLKALRTEGFDVVAFFNGKLRPFEINYFHKIINLFRRNLLGDKQYLNRAERKFNVQQYIKRSRELKKQNFDYALFFRADLYPEKMIQNIRKISKKMISDQYDGMEVGRKILDYRPYFDRLFVFDPDDLKNYKHLGLLPITNCWFPDDEKKEEVKQDFFYVGVGTGDRQQKIKKMQEEISGRFSLKAILTIPFFREEQVFKGIQFSHQALTYSENIKEIQSSKCLIDFKLDYHNGLSFRFFEAMYYGKKIITNNSSVKNYDFYHSNNILITDFVDFSCLSEFLEKPYHPVDAEVVSKYGFINWIKYVLDIEPYQQITLPKV